jgi:hypothetical protein
VIRVSGTVTLDTGELVEFAGGPRELAAWERYALSHGLPPTRDARGGAAGLTMMWYLAFECVTRGADHRPAFNDWLGGLVDLSGFDLELPDPTQPVASAERSPLSPPLPGSPPESSGPPIPETSQPSPQF